MKTSISLASFSTYCLFTEPRLFFSMFFKLSCSLILDLPKAALASSSFCYAPRQIEFSSLNERLCPLASPGSWYSCISIYLKSGWKLGSKVLTCARSTRCVLSAKLSPLFWLRWSETSDLVRRSARPNSNIISEVMPMPDKFRCIRLLFIFMNLQIFMICYIELSILSISAAAFWA